MPEVIDAEKRRIEESRNGAKNWRRWGPYLSERQWGTVREDYSPGGTAWDSFPHDHARSRVPLGRGWPARHLGQPRALVFFSGAVERKRSHSERAALRTYGTRGQSRRRRQGVLLLHRLEAVALLHAGLV